MEFEAEELSGHLRCGDYWIYEETMSHYELHYQKTLSVDGWVEIGTYDSLEAATAAAVKHSGGEQ